MPWKQTLDMPREHTCWYVCTRDVTLGSTQHRTLYFLFVTMASASCSSTSSSEFEEELENVAAFVLLQGNKRRKWVHEINIRRKELGEYHRLVQELKEHPDRFHMYFRMTEDEFNFLHDLIKAEIEKQDTQFREAIGTKERLAVCLR